MAVNLEKDASAAKNPADAVKYCANLDATYTANGATLTCRDWAAWVDKQVTWFAN